MHAAAGGRHEPAYHNLGRQGLGSKVLPHCKVPVHFDDQRLKQYALQRIIGKRRVMPALASVTTHIDVGPQRSA